jgi:hypothetical protein
MWHPTGNSSTSSTDWVKLKTITLGIALDGKLFTTFYIFGAGGTYYGEVRKNGTLVGTTRSSVATGTPVDTFTEQLTVVWAVGDTIELWGKVSVGTATAYLTGFGLLFSYLPAGAFTTS